VIAAALAVASCGQATPEPPTTVEGIWFACANSACLNLEAGGVQFTPDGTYLALTVQQGGISYCERTAARDAGTYSFDGQRLRMTPRGAVGCDVTATVRQQGGDSFLEVGGAGCGLTPLMRRAVALSRGACVGPDGGSRDGK
jgi:hypothetical protein